MNVNKVIAENLISVMSVRQSLHRHDMQSLWYEINTGDSYILHFRYVQYISPDCQKDVNKKDTSKWQLLIHTRNSTLTSQKYLPSPARNSHHGINMFHPTSCSNRNTHEIDTVTTCASCVCIYRLSLLSLSSWHGLFLDRLFEDRRRGGINTRDLMYVKFCWSFYLNCSLDRENSLYKAFKRRTKDV